MELVHVTPKNFHDYLPYLDEDVAEELKNLAARLKGARIAMINATAFGGGVSEKLHSLVPLIKDLGVELDWWVIRGEIDFYQVTKSFHNRMQGQEGELDRAEVDIFLEYNRRNAAYMDEWDYDIIVAHDPQPAALINYRKNGDRSRWVWRCHIDTSTPNQQYWDFIYHYIRQYDATIFTMRDFVNEEASLNNLTFITPSIDPLSTKNVVLEREQARQILSRFGIDDNRPLLTQVSRFDPWKDPLGVIEMYKIVKKELPSVQLALVGSMASDDPEGWDYLYNTLRRAGEDYDIKIVTNFNGITNIEVNAFQTVSDVIIQKSLREGFGLTVAEGLWKGSPVIGGKVGGIKLQIEEGVNGFLVETVEECAEKALNLLRNPAVARDFAAAGKEKVRREFLTTTNALNYLRLFDKLIGSGSQESGQ
jgi:trehalose synthase